MPCRWLEGNDSINGLSGVTRLEATEVRLTFPPPGTGSVRPVDGADEPPDVGRDVRAPLDGVRLRGGTGATGVGCTGIRLDTVLPAPVAVVEVILMVSAYAALTIATTATFILTTYLPGQPD